MQIPLNPLLYERIQENHEQEMRRLRAWYIRHHNLPIRDLQGDDRQVLDQSVEYVFPCKIYVL